MQVLDNKLNHTSVEGKYEYQLHNLGLGICSSGLVHIYDKSYIPHMTEKLLDVYYESQLLIRYILNIHVKTLVSAITCI